MPQAYVQKMAKKHGLSVGEAEKIWDRAKKASNDPENFAIVTHIFQNMIGEKAKAALGADAAHEFALILERATNTRGWEIFYQRGVKGVSYIPKTIKQFKEVKGIKELFEVEGTLQDFNLEFRLLPQGVLFGCYYHIEGVAKLLLTTQLMPTKGFFRNKLIKKLGLFDPAKIKQLAK